MRNQEVIKALKDFVWNHVYSQPTNHGQAELVYGIRRYFSLDTHDFTMRTMTHQQLIIERKNLLGGR